MDEHSTSSLPHTVLVDEQCYLSLSLQRLIGPFDSVALARERRRPVSRDETHQAQLGQAHGYVLRLASPSFVDC